MTKKIVETSYHSLIGDIGKLLEQGRIQAAKKVNTILVTTYWHVGKSIVEFEQAGTAKAEYGKELLIRLSKDLKNSHGKGFSRSNLQYMRLLYVHYPKYQTLSDKLSWSHYVELLSISDDAGRVFYEKQCISESWSVRELSAVLVERIKSNVTIDWNIKENVRAKMKVIVKRLLRKYGYPPDMQALAAEMVLDQANLFSDFQVNHNN